VLADTREQGGIFELRGIVQLADVSRCGSPPEIEDHAYRKTESAFERLASDDELWTALEAVAQSDLQTIFGPDLRERGQTYALGAGTGAASLGCVRAPKPLDLYFGLSRGKPRLRLAVSLDGRDRNLAVTDLRLFRPDFSAPDEVAVEELDNRLSGAETVLLTVGLTRPLQIPGEDARRHWLQVNSIFCR
jgi:hypothetical protein